jgi:glyoxylase-like metal-dependent hydrolase (beta-lactamase superfamily II)
MPALPTAQIPGVYHRRVGDILVTAVCDGYMDGSYDIFRNVDADEVDEVLAAAFRPSPPRISINCFIVRAKDRIALVDTGSADSMGPTLGRLPESMAAAGIGFADVDTVLLTHVHPDHSNALTAPDGTRNFDNAELVVSEADVRHWHDDAEMAKANERQKLRYFQWGRFQLKPYADRRRHAAGEVFPGVTALPIPGHTPGHTAYIVASGGETMMIWGDTCHVPEIQLRRPSATMIFDSDPDAAAASRRRVLDMVATDRLLVGGMHLHFPGFAHIVRDGAGYDAIPESWAFTV